MTTSKEKNVFNIAIEGHFDDCQNLVKSMFSDQGFSNSINMSGVNSINWARIIAQSVYYFYAYFKSEFVKSSDYKELINFSVPTGNFGDVYAGYLAKKMGLPINKLIVATNKNDILHRAISSGNYEAKKVFQTLAPSMDIQVASNFERLIYDINDFNDTETEKIMTEIKKTGKYKIPKDKITKINYPNVEIQMHNDDNLEKLYEAIKEKGNCRIKISFIKENKNYLFELKEKRKFDYETLKNLNKERYIKKISL